MRIEKIEIRGFGKLSRFRFAFEPEMNVIWGPNEAGKTTLLEFLYRMLFGFRDEDSDPEEARARDRWRPWGGGPYGGQIRLALADRRRVQIDRDFEENTLAIREVTSRESRFHGDEESDEGDLRAESLLGMPASVYRTTAMLRPGRAADVLGHPSPVREALLAAEGGRGGSPELDRAAKSVRERMEKRIGEASSRFSPLAAKKARLELLAAELSRIRKKQASLGKVRREISRIEDRPAGNRRRGKASKKLGRLRARAANITAGERDRAVVEEEIRVCEEEIEVMEEAREAHLLASRLLETASGEEYEGFAGDLVSELQRTIPRVTVGRYRVGAVDPEDLSLTVEAPGAPGPVPVEHFSQGTRIQLFGVLRFAISRYLGRAHEAAPLLLDEPYAECDPDRLAASCGNLLDVAREHQVVVVTHNRRILELCGVSQHEVRRVVVPEGARRRGLRAVRRR